MEALEASRQIYDLLVAGTHQSPPRVRNWSGEEWGPSDAVSTLVLARPGALGAYSSRRATSRPWQFGRRHLLAAEER